MATGEPKPVKPTKEESMLDQAMQDGPLQLVSPEQPLEEDMTVLFSIDGKDYLVPSAPKAAHGLRFLAEAREYGQPAAAASLLQRLLGAEAFTALMDWEHLTDDQLMSVLVAVQRLTMGPIEKVDKAGNSARGPGR